jgi:hypothetical protein
VFEFFSDIHDQWKKWNAIATMSQYYAKFPKQFTLRSLNWNAKDRKAVAGGSVLFKNGGSRKYEQSVMNNE